MPGGYVRWNELESVLSRWSSRIDIKVFGIIGGEPFLNPELDLWIKNLRYQYPSMEVMVVTNAQLFLQNLWFLDVMREVGNIHLKFSVHQPNANYLKNAVDTVLKRFKWEAADSNNEQSEIKSYSAENNIHFQIAAHSSFLKTYQGVYGSMKPYNNNPIESFKICVQKECPLLYQGKLYKCSSLALLKQVLGDHKQLDDADWHPYLDEKIGLDVNCSDIDLERWVNNYAKPHSVCRMCPTEKDHPYRPHWPMVINKTKIT